MRVLYINHPESDYGGAFLYLGLCSVLGPENVYDHPPKLSYHGVEHRYSLEGLPNGCTMPNPWFDAQPAPYDLNDVDGQPARVRALLDQGYFNLVVIESARPVALRTFTRLKDRIAAQQLGIILHDGEDYSDIKRVVLNTVSPNVYLKREMTFDRYQHEDFLKGGVRFIGFPFSSCRAVLEFDPSSAPQTAPEMSISLCCGNTYKDRQIIANALLEDPDIAAFVAISPDASGRSGPLLPWEHYMRRIVDSRMVVSVRGFGLDTVRFWEAGPHSILVCDQRKLHYHNPFIHMDTCIEYHRPEDCTSVIKHVLSAHSEKLDGIRERGIAHARKHHTNRVRGEFVVGVANDMGLVKNVPS